MPHLAAAPSVKVHAIAHRVRKVILGDSQALVRAILDHRTVLEVVGLTSAGLARVPEDLLLKSFIVPQLAEELLAVQWPDGAQKTDVKSLGSPPLRSPVRLSSVLVGRLKQSETTCPKFGGGGKPCCEVQRKMSSRLSGSAYILVGLRPQNLDEIRQFYHSQMRDRAALHAKFTRLPGEELIIVQYCAGHLTRLHEFIVP